MPNTAPVRLLMLISAALSIAPALGADGTPAGDSEMAMIGARRLTFSELPATASKEIDGNQTRYEQQLHQLALDHKREIQSLIESNAGRYLDDELLRQEAQARNVTVEDLEKQIKVPEVTDADLHAFYDANAPQIGKPFAAISSQLGQYLRQQAAERERRAFLDGLRAKYDARVTIEPLREQVEPVGPSLGRADARVTIVEFSDFQCPFCQKLEPELKQLMQKYPRDVRLVYRQLPLIELHPNALLAAKASLCASDQGKFWEMHDAMFADQNALGGEALKKTADKLHLKAKAFDTCLDDPKIAARVEADAKAGISYGVSGTPGLFINGRFVNGVVPLEDLEKLVDDELRRSGGSGKLALTTDKPVAR